jgi:2-polyprenyl-3-methyl-5-hydroxy-6-metoxy-1,4-benzoquinol methylase
MTLNIMTLNNDMSDAPELEYVRCNGCGSDTPALFQQLDRWQVVRCRQCDLKYLNPRPTAAKLDELYASDYFEQHYTFPDIEGPIAQASPLVRQIERRLGRKGTFLDVGCGYGYTVAAAQRQGWTAKGIDISSHAVNFAVTQLGVAVEEGTTESWQPDQRYDVVFCSHNLEHVPDPMQALIAMRSYMKPDHALLHVRVPNVASFDRRWHGRQWRGWDPPFHLWHFEPKTLTAMMQQAGFHRVEVVTGSFNPFLHLLADVQHGEWRGEGQGYTDNAVQEANGAGEKALGLLSKLYSRGARLLPLNRILADRTLALWASIGDVRA